MVVLEPLRLLPLHRWFPAQQHQLVHDTPAMPAFFLSLTQARPASAAEKAIWKSYRTAVPRGHGQGTDRFCQNQPVPLPEHSVVP